MTPLPLAEDEIFLTEYEDWQGTLAAQDAAFIRTELARRIGITRDPEQDIYQLNPGPNVGVTILPSGRRIECSPKVDARNLFYMIAMVQGLSEPFRDELAQYDRLEKLFEFVADYFARLVEERIDAGLHRAYVEAEDNLSIVRGRIDFVQDVRENYVLRHRKFCRYAEFTWDIPENQVIRQVAHMLAGWSFSTSVQRRLSRIDSELAEVTTTQLPASAIDRFRYHRLNDNYRQVHELCRLFLEGASLSEEFGAFNFRTFLIDMNVLFERFIVHVLQESVKPPLSIIWHRPSFLAANDRVPIEPDILLTQRSLPLLVADCKYKKIAPDEFKNHDVYQVLAYCTAERVRKGLLIYPKHMTTVSEDIKIRNTNVTIREVTVDLGKLGAEFDSECDDFTQKVLAWAQSEGAAVGSGAA